MLDGMKLASQGMLAMMAKQDVISNNLANASTAGFSADTLMTTSFSDALTEKMADKGFTPVGGVSDGVPKIGVKVATAYQQGAMRATGINTDLAIGGKGFFTIQTPQGIRYTKNGAFKINEEGYLVTANNEKVLGFNGPIKVEGDNFQVDDNGVISIDGKKIDRLRITEFDNMDELVKAGGTNYMPKSPSNIGRVSSDPMIKQGFLEMSNVSTIKEMVAMMDVMRAYELNSKALQTEDQMLAKSVNEVGKA